jgi:hypothetical protein
MKFILIVSWIVLTVITAQLIQQRDPALPFYIVAFRSAFWPAWTVGWAVSEAVKAKADDR